MQHHWIQFHWHFIIWQHCTCLFMHTIWLFLFTPCRFSITLMVMHSNAYCWLFIDYQSKVDYHGFSAQRCTLDTVHTMVVTLSNDLLLSAATHGWMLTNKRQERRRRHACKRWTAYKSQRRKEVCSELFVCSTPTQGVKTYFVSLGGACLNLNLKQLSNRPVSALTFCFFYLYSASHILNVWLLLFQLLLHRE